MIIAENGTISQSLTEEQIAQHKKSEMIYIRQRAVDYAMDYFKTSNTQPRSAAQVVEAAEVFYQYTTKE